MSLTKKQWLQRASKIKDWSGAVKAADEQGGSVPDGRYHAKVTSAELTESQSSGREQINLFAEIVEEGDYQGQSIGMFLGLDPDKSLPWTIAALRRCGFTVKEDPENEIFDAVTSLSEELPEITVRVKNGFGNLEGLFQKAGEDEIGEDEAPAEEEEVAEEEVVEEETPSEEEQHVEVGSQVEFNWKGETLQGEVKEVDENAGKLKVKVGTKVYPVAAEKATILVAEEEAPVEEEEVVEEEPIEEPEPKKKGKPMAKKVAPKATAKKVNKKR